MRSAEDDKVVYEILQSINQSCSWWRAGAMGQFKGNESQIKFDSSTDGLPRSVEVVILLWWPPAVNGWYAY